MPEQHPEGDGARLVFESTDFDPASGRLDLYWTLRFEGQPHSLTESFTFGPSAPLHGARKSAFDAAVRALHWIAGVSYWKAAPTGSVEFVDAGPDAAQAAFLTDVYRDGLAELAWRNRLAPPWWPRFEGSEGAAPKAPRLALDARALVPMGGGKDSLVALERVRASGIPFETVQVGQAPLIAEVARHTGVPHRRIVRRIDPLLASINAQGAINGHVPITAINAAALAVAAVLWNVRDVVFANERSADQPTLEVDGRTINHQWAKSLAFEAGFADWLQRSVAADLRVFSILRRESELSVVRAFAKLEQYHDVFSSCNRNFHLDGPRTERWCGRCPKCQFVYLTLATCLPPERLNAIFGRDLLDDRTSLEGFAALAELDGPRPFECVGEADEARAALLALAEDPAWSKRAVVAALAPRLASLAVPALAELMRPEGPDRIPEPYRDLAAG